MVVINVTSENTDVEEVRALSEESREHMSDVEKEALEMFFTALLDSESVEEAVGVADGYVDWSVLDVGEEVSNLEEFRSVAEEFMAFREQSPEGFDSFATVVKYVHGFGDGVAEGEARAAVKRGMEMGVNITVSVDCSWLVSE